MASTANQPEAIKEKKGRWRMSGLLGKNKERDQQIIEEEEEEVGDITPPSASRPNLNDTNADQRDSAYGSASNKTDSSLGLPTISQNQAEQTDAPVKIQTDRGTGRRVVVVTTTTKTEVFDTDGEGHSVPAGKDVVVRKTETDDTPAQPQDVGATRVTETRDSPRPDVPRRSSRRSMSPGRRPRMSDIGVSSDNPAPREAEVARNTTSLNRQSDTNYSFPRPPSNHVQNRNGYNGNSQQSSYQSSVRADNGGYNNSHNNSYNNQNQGGYAQNQPSYSQHQPVQPPMDPVERVVSPYSGSIKRRPVPGQNGEGQRMGTFDSLKAAAAGIHGAGETIRGAINSKVEQRTGGSAETIAAHDAVRSRGLQEISTGQFSHGADIGAPVNSGLTGTAVQPPAGEQPGYELSPYISQAQEGYQDNVPYLPDPLGEAPPAMAYSLGRSDSRLLRKPVGVSPFDAKYGAGGDESLDGSSDITPVATPGVDQVGDLDRRATLYGSVPTKKGKLRNVLRRKSQRAV